MKNSTRKIFVSILTLVLTVVAVGTTTFAWFTIGNIATVSGISAEVIGGEGLETQMVIDIKSTSFKNHLVEADWDLVKPANFEFTAIDSNLKKLETILSGNNTGKLKEGKTAVQNGDYLEITFNFRSLSGGNVVLSNLVFDEVMTDAFEANVAYTGLGGVMIAADAPTPSFDANMALRLTFARGEAEEVTYRKDHSVSKDHGQWAYLTAKGNEIYEADGTTKVTAARMYSGDKYDGTPGTGNAFTVALVEGADYWEASVTVLVWVDGWDPHTFDAIYLEELSFQLTFTKE